MTEELPKFRYYKLEGTGLEVLKAYQAELDAMIADNRALEKEFAERLEKQGAYHRMNLQAMWKRMAASVGLSHKDTWGSPEYQIETRYFAAGFGAILFTPRHTNPMHEMLEDVPVAERSDPETDIPPDDTTKH